jgi:hypothetical protein
VARVKEILPDVLEVRCVYAEALPAPATSGVSQGNEAAAETGSNLDPTTQLRAYYRQDRGAELPEAIGTLFTQLYEETLRATA